MQGRTYAMMFGLVERFISAKVLDVSREHWLGDQVALEALVRMGDEELKHQELFRRLEAQMGEDMTAGYTQAAEQRHRGFSIQAMASGALLVGALIGIVWTMV